MDRLDKLITDVIIEETKCINQISNLNISCKQCPYAYMNSELRLTCALQELKRNVYDVKRRTLILLNNFEDVIIDIR